MDAQFWHAKWARNEIGFHGQQPHAGFVRYFPALGVARGCRVFVPLCGKSLDIHWLIKNGYQVVGVELSRLAVEQLFAELQLEPAISTVAQDITVFEAKDIKIFVADIFSLTPDMLGPVDVIYDRAALVALPEDMRARYVRHLMALTGCAMQFVVCVEYDQSRLSGPPFAVMEQDIRRYYGEFYHVESIDTQPVARGIKGREPGCETIWLLKPLRWEQSKTE